MERVRECRSLPNDAARNPCIVAALEGRAQSEQELRMLAVTYMAMGRTHDAVRVLRRLPARQGDGGLPLPGVDPRGDFPFDPCRGLEGVAPDQRPPHCS